MKISLRSKKQILLLSIALFIVGVVPNVDAQRPAGRSARFHMHFGGKADIRAIPRGSSFS